MKQSTKVIYSITIKIVAFVLCIQSQISNAQAPTSPAPTEVVAPDGPMDAVPPTSKCPRDRKLSSTLRYAILPLKDQIGDPAFAEAIDVFIKGSPASRRVNALVIQFDVKGGTQQEVAALADQILKIRKIMPVIGVFGSVYGPGAVLPVFCDYLVVLNPNADDVVMDWSPGSDLLDVNFDEQVRTNLSTITSRASDRPYWKSFLKSLLDPTADLFLWKGSDGCPEAGESAPAEIDAFQLSSGKDALTGMTGAQLVTAGIAISVNGGIEQIGSALGVKSWQVQAGVGEKIVQEIQTAKTKELEKWNFTYNDGFAAIKSALNLTGAMIEAESIARDADPRRQEYQGSYSRSWRRGGWSSSTGGTYSWRKNCDTAIDAWNLVSRLYRQASDATSHAKKMVSELAANPLTMSNPDFKSDFNALRFEVDALMLQSGMLTVKGQNAESAMQWLRANYNQPVGRQ
ncbi:MAG: hypothetical protein O2875_01090 [Planctomycetota bacterium]|nr:hypothetical protein [Planctomycetota bacterium]MDA1261484.1 hypothetical protein [Planctomycetota bacterium]